MKEKEINRYFAGLESQLKKGTIRQSIQLDLKWIKSLKNLDVPGVYMFFENNQPCYVRETGNLKKRMNDLRNTKNHTLRRNFGHKHFQNHPKFSKASAKISFDPEIETLLVKMMVKSITVSLLPVSLGRKEFEEYLCNKYDLLNRYNLRSKRK